MPRYDYKCQNPDCDHSLIDVIQSFYDDAFTKCEKCNQNTLERVLYTPYFTIKNDPTTIGQLAERNSQKMGKIQIDDKYHSDKEAKKQALSEAKKEMRSKINKMSEAKKRRYIEDGEI